jgi:hypothetical protein
MEKTKYVQSLNSLLSSLVDVASFQAGYIAR